MKDKNKNILLAICGMAGSGKTEATKYFEELGFVRMKFGVTEYVIEKYGETTEQLEREERNLLREKEGMGVFAKLAIKKIRENLEAGSSVVIENMYSWSEYKILKEQFPEYFVTLAILAAPETRYERLALRSEVDGRKSYKDHEISRDRDYSEIEEIEKGGPIAMADHYLVNNGSIAEFEKQLQSLGKIL